MEIERLFGSIDREKAMRQEERVVIEQLYRDLDMAPQSSTCRKNPVLREEIMPSIVNTEEEIGAATCAYKLLESDPRLQQEWQIKLAESLAKRVYEIFKLENELRRPHSKSGDEVSKLRQTLTDARIDLLPRVKIFKGVVEGGG